jgi:hypothetical protein
LSYRSSRGPISERCEADVDDAGKRLEQNSFGDGRQRICEFMLKIGDGVEQIDLGDGPTTIASRSFGAMGFAAAAARSRLMSSAADLASR